MTYLLVELEFGSRQRYDEWIRLEQVIQEAVADTVQGGGVFDVRTLDPGDHDRDDVALVRQLQLPVPDDVSATMETLPTRRDHL